MHPARIKLTLALNSKTPTIKAVLDYHDPNEGGATSDPVPGRTHHIATYSPRHSEQWSRWCAACSGPLRQVEFAELIEECREDIREPSAAAMIAAGAQVIDIGGESSRPGARSPPT